MDNFLNNKLMEKNETLQNNILQVIKKLEVSDDARTHFLGIVGVMLGREHSEYPFFCNLTRSGELQQQMMQSTKNRRQKQLWDVFRHIVIKNYIHEMTEKKKFYEKDILLEHYLVEMEKASQYKPVLTELNKERFMELKELEYSVFRKILPHSPNEKIIIGTEFEAEDIKKLLSVWAMYAEYIYYPEKISKVVELCKSQRINL